MTSSSTTAKIQNRRQMGSYVMKRQPTADCMREQLVLAADEIIRCREAIARNRFWLSICSCVLACSALALAGWFLRWWLA